jgi:nucleoside-diphosphate-sugar epimerase
MTITVFGCGPTGRAIVERLAARGDRVRLVQRRRPEDLPAGVEFMACDVLKPADVHAALDGAAQAVVTIGFAYSGKVWREAWPKAMANLIAGGEASGARIVHVDNLYMYGAQDAPLREDMPLTTEGVKPAVRARVSRIWMEAAGAGRLRFAALRAPDFYGPGVSLSHMGDTGLKAVAEGKSAIVMMKPDASHAYAYVPDIARAAATLLDAPDDAFGQVWHVPCAPAISPREMLAMGAELAGVRLKMMVVPPGLLPLAGLVSPAMKEFAEMRFTYDRPYEVDWSKWAARFWSDPTPMKTGIARTMASYLPVSAGEPAGVRRLS